MSESRVKKFQKLFGQQISSDEKLINYFSCALVSEILLQGHLYISENYFSFYSNVFGFITKLIIPITTVTTITREKTAKFFPNAIKIELTNEGSKHVFGSFLSRETAYQLMSSIHRKLTVAEPEALEEPDVDEIDAQTQDVEVSSLEDSSSIGSGSEVALAAVQYQLPVVPPVNEIQEEIQSVDFLSPANDEPMGKVGNYNVKLMNEFNLLFVGICLTILLAFFSGLLLLKINAIEKHSGHEAGSSDKLTIEDAENILNRNVLIVRNVRQKLEDLQVMLQHSFDKSKQEL